MPDQTFNHKTSNRPTRHASRHARMMWMCLNQREISCLMPTAAPADHGTARWIMRPLTKGRNHFPRLLSKDPSGRQLRDVLSPTDPAHDPDLAHLCLQTRFVHNPHNRAGRYALVETYDGPDAQDLYAQRGDRPPDWHRKLAAAMTHWHPYIPLEHAGLFCGPDRILYVGYLLAGLTTTEAIEAVPQHPQYGNIRPSIGWQRYGQATIRRLYGDQTAAVINTSPIVAHSPARA